jgi:hypothetical protein
MIALNILLMLAVVVGIVSLLAWAVTSDRKSYRTAGGEISPAEAPLHRNLTMPHELRARRARPQAAPRRRPATGSSLA